MISSFSKLDSRDLDFDNSFCRIVGEIRNGDGVDDVVGRKLIFGRWNVFEDDGSEFLVEAWLFGCASNDGLET